MEVLTMSKVGKYPFPLMNYCWSRLSPLTRCDVKTFWKNHGKSHRRGSTDGTTSLNLFDLEHTRLLLEDLDSQKRLMLRLPSVNRGFFAMVSYGFLTLQSLLYSASQFDSYAYFVVFWSCFAFQYFYSCTVAAISTSHDCTMPGESARPFLPFFCTYKCI